MYQTSLFSSQEEEIETWTKDDWETPNEVAKKMASLVSPSDKKILVPAAGRGQIAKFLPRDRTITAVEIKKSRVRQGQLQAPHCTWVNGDFFTQEPSYFDLIIDNPPFSLRIEFIKHCLPMLNPENSESRILFLLPIDWYCGKLNGENWRNIDGVIHHQYTIQDRVSYLDSSGVPQKGRQVYDAVFDIRKSSKSNIGVEFL